MADLNEQIRHCIQQCLSCSSLCFETLSRSLELGGSHAEKTKIATFEICAEICQTTARSMILGSALHKELCEACAAICDACAKTCESESEDFLLECGRSCRDCAAACLKVIEPTVPQPAAISA